MRILQRLVALTLIVTCLHVTDAWAAEPRADGSWLSRVRLLPDENERSHRSVKSAFRDVVQRANRSTVRVMLDGLQVALGAIVHKDGYVLTKASELRGPVEVQLTSGRRFPADLVGVQTTYDIALLKVEASGLPVAKWSAAQSPAVGSWLASAGIGEYPTAIGIVSAEARTLPKPQTVLGVGLEQFGEQARVNRVLAGSSAAKAGIRRGDVIASINGDAMISPRAVSSTIREMLPGDEVTMMIKRDNRSLSLTAVLGEVSRLGNPDQADLMDSLGGPLSKRRHGFPYVLQHDTVLRPKDCGGPVVDLDGKIIGLNIARVSRVASYAIPAHQIKPLLADLLSGKHPPPSDNLTLKRVSTTD